MDLGGILIYISGFIIMASIYGIFSIGLNIHWGFTGLFNIGIAGFFAIGAYSSALITIEPPDPKLFEDYIFGGNLPEILGFLNLGIDLWFFFALLFAGLICAIIAAPIALITLRLREDYLGMAALGIAETIRLIFLNEAWLANGGRGMYGIPKFLGDMVSPRYYDILYALIAVVILLVIYLTVQRIIKSPWGRVLKSIREDEIAATSLGKNVFSFKVQSFILGAFIMGVGGAVFAHGFRFLDPFTFRPLLSTFIIWTMLMVGGSGNNRGAIAGAFIVWGVWSTTQFLPGFLSSPDLRYFMVGLLIVVMLLFKPNGIIPETIEKRINADLSNNFGNLIQRITSFIEKNCNQIVENKFNLHKEDEELLNLSKNKINEYHKFMNNLEIDKALKEVFELISETNVYIDNQAPWSLKKTDPKQILRFFLVN